MCQYIIVFSVTSIVLFHMWFEMIWKDSLLIVLDVNEPFYHQYDKQTWTQGMALQIFDLQVNQTYDICARPFDNKTVVYFTTFFVHSAFENCRLVKNLMSNATKWITTNNDYFFVMCHNGGPNWEVPTIHAFGHTFVFCIQPLGKMNFTNESCVDQFGCIKIFE